jgi:hypothetical protein
MAWKFQHRPYSGKTYRPTPEIYYDDSTNLLIVATAWGAKSGARKVIDRMVDYIALTREDHEATSPFERLTSLSTQANNLRIATILANEGLYRDENKNEYHSGVELFAAIRDDDEFVWLQCGNPHILLAREGRDLLPLGSQIDLSFELSSKNELLPPLPSQFLGFDSSLNMTINSFHAQANDQIILLSHSSIPDSIYSMKGDAIAIEEISKTLALRHPDLAFWLGILTFNEKTKE